MNEHPHDHTLEKKEPSPWGRVAGILFALSDIAMIIAAPNVVYYYPNMFYLGLAFSLLLVGFFFIRNNRGKGMIIATCLLAALSICLSIYNYISYYSLYKLKQPLQRIEFPSSFKFI